MKHRPSPRRWPLSASIGEGIRNAAHGRTSTAVVLLLIGWGLGAVAGLDAANVHETILAERQFVEAGGRILVAETPTGVDRQRCDALDSTDGVVAAAAVSRLPSFHQIRALPGSQIPVITATSGIDDLIGTAAPVGPQVALTLQLTERIGVGPGETIELIERDQAIGAVTSADVVPTGPAVVSPPVDLSLLGDTYDTGLLIPVAPVGTADACFVWGEPTHLSALQGALPALLTRNGEEATVRTRLFEGEFTVDFQEQYNNRALRHAWVFASLVLTLVWLLLSWTRRSHDALYASVGAHASTRATIRITEWIVLATAGGIWATALGILLAAYRDVPTRLAGEFVARQTIAALALATALIAATSLLWRRASGLSALKDQ
ncbi:MAG: hypothetical protein QNL26_03490 [Acidimicrobiia bacterium]|nr:hypothetical protein [Acidimicrobiia bacterium]